ncbi:MAG: vanadium-dependent haloperoxidase [Cyclobacteriaceae bacterium]
MKGFVKTIWVILSLEGIALNVFSQGETSRQQELKMLADNVFNLSEVMLHDVTSPPAASRVYAYALMGAYEAAFFGKGSLPDINSKLNVNPAIEAPARPKNFNVSFCANYTLLEVGRNIMPSGFLLDEKKRLLIDYFKKTGMLSEREISQHVKYSLEIAKQVVQYAKSDHYNKLSTYTRYTPKKGEGHWYPTPPAYMAAVEPQWQTVRPFFIDSASQFSPSPPAPFSKDSASSFYRQMKEVYAISKTLTDAEKEMANFWDCNPFAVAFSGHMAIGLKKISPGGHWMGITGIACRKADLSLDSAILIHTLVATTLHDAFISCWQEKFSSDRIRPEAAINKYLDSEWRPLLQTPPFPEYTSGHSVASSSVAVVLTYLLGNNFSFTDTSEIYFGLPEREFKSFNDAANEAALSRLYGGIHFRDACEQGVAQGRRIGQFVLNNLLDNQP